MWQRRTITTCGCHVHIHGEYVTTLMCVKLATQTAMHHTRAGPCLRVIAVENAHGNRVAVAPEVDGETSHRYSGVIHIT